MIGVYVHMCGRNVFAIKELGRSQPAIFYPSHPHAAAAANEKPSLRLRPPSEAQKSSC